MKYLAHISKDGREQTILEHLTGTAELAKSFAESFSLGDQAYRIGHVHDIGKYSDEFQNRLHGGKKIDHSTAGAFEAFKKQDIETAFCVAGHHSGLPDGGNRTALEGRSLLARLNRAGSGSLPDYSYWDKENIIKWQKSCADDCLVTSYRIRMLFSCLVDADFIDTERFMDTSAQRGVPFDIDYLDSQLMKYISGWYPPKGSINELRCRLLQQSIDIGCEADRGIFSMTVPTGGGKTIASLAFAIKHARHLGLSRIIYVIPYTSIIEQTSDIFRKVLGDQVVLEHHSGMIYGEDEDSLFYLRNTENWDMPVVVTTSVQFFESFYGNRPSSSRKLHNTANSVIIFDEAQMLPTSYLRPCVRLLTELVNNYKTSVVLCTATQPALNKMIQEFWPGCTVKEICPDDIFQAKEFKRVRFKMKGTMEIQSLVEEIQSLDQVLVIVNSRAYAKELYQLMEDDIFHLSTFMYPEHRRRVLKEIRSRLERGIPCRVISTSLIEAGIDVDFPIVYRQIAGLDSIIQAAGRCNREGHRQFSQSIVNIFDLPNGSPELFSSQIASAKQVLEHAKEIDSKEAINEYFRRWMYFQGSEALDSTKVLEQMSKGDYPFETVAKEFSILGNETRGVYISCPENEDDLNSARNGYADRACWRRLELYKVGLYRYQIDKLKGNGSLEELDNGSYILINSQLYTEDMGLQFEETQGQALFL